MRYRASGREIRTENAAKPASQAAKYLADWLQQRPDCDHALDYGCGKLRYTAHLAARARRITLVDSAVQLTRVQRLDEVDATVVDVAAARWPTCRVLNIQAFKTDRERYDRILCANVLSAIPSHTIRSAVIEMLNQRLRPHGECLFVTQYYNSYFKEVERSGRAIQHLDGWIIDSLRGAAYYAALDRDWLLASAQQHRLPVVKCWREGQSALLLVGKR